MEIDPKTADLQAIKLVELLIQQGLYTRAYAADQIPSAIVRDIKTIANGLTNPGGD